MNKPLHNEIIIETERLLLRQMNGGDYTDLCQILMDDETMHYYEGAFTAGESARWLDNQFARYSELGFGLWAVIHKQTGEFLGQCGLTMQSVEEDRVLEIGYLFKKKHWHKGYAIEAAKACKLYAFETLGAEEVFSIIRDTNIPSQNVAIRNGMLIKKRFIKHYLGIDMPHMVYYAKRDMK